MAIATDGDDEISRKFNLNETLQEIKRCENDNWNLIFLLEGIDEMIKASARRKMTLPAGIKNITEKLDQGISDSLLARG